MIHPPYRGLIASEIPEVVLASGVRVRIVCGSVEDVTGPVADVVTDPDCLDVSIPAHTAFVHLLKPGHIAFACACQGVAYFGDRRDAYAHGVRGSGFFDMQRQGTVGSEQVVPYDR